MPASILIRAESFQSSTTQQVLNSGDSITREIPGGARQSFTIPLTAGQFVQIAVEQGGAILLVTLFDEQNKELIAMDYPGGGHGPIYFSAIATTSGNHRLEVFSVNKWALPSSYKLTIESIRNANDVDQPVTQAYLSFHQGRKNFTDRKFPEAIAAYEKSLSFWTATGNDRWQAVTQFAMSEVHRGRSIEKWEACLNETLRLLELRMDPGDWRLKASAFNDLGTGFISTGPPDKAREVLTKALDLYRDHGDRRGQASALNNLAQLDAIAGDYFKARDLVQQALELRKLENDKPGASNLIGALASISDSLGEPEEALTYATEAVKKWEELGEVDRNYVPRAANALNSLAVTNDKLGKWNDAFELYDKSLASYDKKDSLRASPLDNKGELYAALGDAEKARECYTEALSVLDAAGKPNPNIKASILVHLGQLSLTNGDTDTAIKYFEEARSLKPPDRRLADVLINLGNGLALRDPAKATEAYQNALTIQEKLKDLRGQALALQKRGEARARSGKQNEALDDFNRALTLWKSVKDSRGQAATLNNIAQIERDRGNLAAALARSSEAIQTIESLRTNISSRQLRASYFAAQSNYYELNVDLNMQLGKKENQREYLSAAFESAEKSRARVLLDALNEAGLDRGEFNQTSDPNLAKLLKERSDLLNKLSAKAQARTDSLSRVYSRDQIAIFDREINQLNDRYDALEAKLRSKNPRFATLTKPKPATVKEIQSQLDDQTILIEYFLGETSSYVWVVTQNSIDGFELPARAEIDALAQRVYESLSAYGRHEKNESWTQKNERVAKAENDFPRASSLLSEMILGKIASLLGEKRLLIVADGSLQTLPFGVLPTPGSTTIQTAHATPTAPLLVQHEIVSFPSASVLVLQRRELAGRKPAPHTVAVIADPVFDIKDDRVRSRQPASKPGASTSQRRSLDDIGWTDPSAVPRLGYSFDEASAILKLVRPNETLKALDFKASRTTLLSTELSRYRIIHLATHGIMNLTHPELSGVILSLVDERGQPVNGYVGLNDIYNLNLPVDLVVLSACETGIGKNMRGEGVIALTRGFMHAGAERVVASLWKVDDKATADLMAAFYKEMLVNKRKPAAALRAAELELYRRNLKPHFWAGFVLQGEWR